MCSVRASEFEALLWLATPSTIGKALAPTLGKMTKHVPQRSSNI